MPGIHLHVVPHTHWDREWYRTHEAFRYRLVALLDRLLELLEQDPQFRHFTLDGQVIVLEDYLAVRPAARDRIAQLVRSGRLLIGPWYVLPDEWLVSGEALIRNLRTGIERAQPYGGAMQLGYAPDQFGHVGQLPQIFRGFGFESGALWRGVGVDVDQTLFEWRAPDGSTLLTVYLMRGYGNGSNLPLSPEPLAERLRAEIAALEGHSPIPSLLLMNGSDHLEPQAGLPKVLADAVCELAGVEVEIGTLPAFVERARHEHGELQTHEGELRSGLRSPLLGGCASARISQKRSDFENDRLLTRYVEPLAAWVQAQGGQGDRELIDWTWRIALENHPHDSICGCSIDAVHEQMETRFARVLEIGRAHLGRLTSALAARVRTPATRDGVPVLVWNPGASGRVVVEGEIEADLPSRSPRPAVHLRGADGERIPATAIRVEAGAVLAEYAFAATSIAVLLRGFPPEFMGEWVVACESARRRGRLEIDLLFGAEPASGFDFLAEKARLASLLEQEGDRVVRFRARRRSRYRLRFADEIPGCGLRTYSVERGAVGSDLFAERRDAGASARNEHWVVDVGADGVVDLTHRATGRRVRDALRVVSEGDRGDEYTFDPVVDGVRIERPDRVRIRLLPATSAEVGIRIDAVYGVPRELSPDRASRVDRLVRLPLRIELRLAPGVDRIDLRFEVDNTARDHRLRAHLRAPFEARQFEIESAFEVATRPINPSPGDFGRDRPAEYPTGASPQRSFATVSDGSAALTVANRGSPEVEAVPEADGTASIAVTLLRAVGWLSRGDLLLRPVHAGPAMATPAAQVPGPHTAELSVRLHAAGEAERGARAHHFAFPPLLFQGGSEQGPLADGDRLLEVDDPCVVVSAVEPAPTAGEGTTLRVVNLSAEPREVRLRWNGSASGRLSPVDLRGAPSARADFRASGDGRFAVVLRPWEIAGFRAD